MPAAKKPVKKKAPAKRPKKKKVLVKPSLTQGKITPFWDPYKHAIDAFEKGMIKVEKVVEPPCTHCKFFRPTVQASENHNKADNMEVGIRVCWASEMHYDFSCFIEKKE